MKIGILIYVCLISMAYSDTTSFLKKASLSIKDVEELRAQYIKELPLYSETNEAELSKSLPIISTNPHHRSVQYWLKSQLRNRNLRGLPILHLDSHTDMGFSPNAYSIRGKLFPVEEILNSLSEEKINSFSRSLTDISQVLIPIMSTKLVNKFHMCMPPWYKRTNKFNKVISFSLSNFNRANFVNSTTGRMYPINKQINKYTSSPFIHSKKYASNLKGEMTFYRCFEGKVPNIKGKFILSLDLDILSTNGEVGEHAKPISFHRSSKDSVNKKEFYEFKQRLNKILKLLIELKKRGATPAIITIADSTSFGGGGYTPIPLALIANRYLKRKLKMIYK